MAKAIAGGELYVFSQQAYLIKPAKDMPNQKKLWKTNSLIAFFGGLFGASVLFIVFYLLFNIAYFKSPFSLTPLGSFLHLLIINSFIEEGTKFLLIKREIGEYPYGFLLGLGFETSEAILVHPFWQSKQIFQVRLTKF